MNIILCNMDINKINRNLRLQNKSPNLTIKLFLDMRRNDWISYLNELIITSFEFKEGIDKWLNEDKEGAGNFLKNIQTG